MGEVYRARDTRLDRSVAIKVLPRELSRNADLRARFAREAKVISALANPHICVLHDVGSHDGVDFLVMELLEGETLADRLTRGPLRLDDALHYGAQIAGAMAHAHSAGITHRDLKPANIMITKSGAKVLDFGLAKFSNVSVTTSAVTEKPLTAEGTVLGTLQYMAPEQLEGRTQDERTDVFAFGAVLFEMITGRRAFEGKSRISLIAAILEHDPPPLASFQPITPPALERVVRTCLAKDPENRFQSARDIVLELEWISRERSGSSPHPAAATPRRWQAAIPWAIAAVSLLIAAAIATGFWKTNRAEPPRRAIRRLAILLPPGQPLLQTQDPFAVSPDGKSIVYSSNQGSGATHLELLRLDGSAPSAIPGTEGARNPFFSADGDWMAFGADRQLKKVHIASGTVFTLCDAPDVRGGVWTGKGEIVFAAESQGPLVRVSPDGGKPEPVTRLNAGETGHRFPDLLPDDDHVLFTVLNAAGHSTIDAVSLSDGTRNPIMKGTRARHDAQGHLIVAVDRMILAFDFDLKTLRTRGKPVTLARDLDASDPFGLAPFAALPDGSVVFLSASARVKRRNLVVLDRKGVGNRLNSVSRSYDWLRYSPDGQRIVVADWDDNVWICDAIHGLCNRLDLGEKAGNPIWSTDGTQVIFTCGPESKADLCQQAVDGRSGRTRLTNNTGQWVAPVPFAASPDGRLVVFGIQDSRGSWDIHLANLEEKPAKITPLIVTNDNEFAARLSPDGKWITYISNASGRSEILVQSFPIPGRKWQISTEGGFRPIWSPRGDEIFFAQGNQMMSVAVTTQPVFSSQPPRTLFVVAHDTSFDVAPDGQHFMLTVPTDGQDQFPHLTIVEGAIDVIAK